MALDDTRKPVSTLNGLRAAAFFSTFCGVPRHVVECKGSSV
jgi:hypothetical protein